VIGGGPRRRLGLAALVGLVALGSCRVTLRFPATDSGGPPPEPCAGDVDCPLTSLHCDTSSGVCFPCLVDADCSANADRPRCDMAQHICIQCGTVGDCPAGSRCLGQTCVQSCTTTADCTTAGVECDDGTCGQCDEDRECSGSTPYCAANHQCASCTTNGQCSAAAPRCNPTIGRCVACLTSNDCQTGWVCDPSDWICKDPTA
jgi:hypothetical protein